MTGVHEFAIRLALIDRATRPFRAAIGFVKRGTATLNRHARSLQNLGLKAGLAGEIFQRGAARMHSAIRAPLNDAIAFESAMADVRKVVNFDNPAQFAAMGRDLQRLSTRIPIAADGLAAIVAEAGQAGIARGELPRFAEDAARMATAFDISADQAGSAMAGLRTIFALNQDGAVGLADTFNHLSNNMASTAPDLLNVANRAGSAAKLIGLSGQQLGALASAMLAMKTPPEVAGTGINAMLMKLATADKQGKTFQKALGAIGLSAQELRWAIADDAQGAILDFLEAVKGSDDVVGTLADLFGAEYADDVAKLVNGFETYRKAVALAADATGAAGSMNREFAARSKTTANAQKLLDNNLNRLRTTLGSAVLPVFNQLLGTLMPIVDGFTTFAEANPELAKGLIVGAMLLAGFFVVAAKTLSVVGGLIAMVGFAGPALAKLGAGAGLLSKGVVLLAGGLGKAALAAGTFSAALLANPITWIILGIVALGAAVWLLWRNWDTVTEWVGGVWDRLKAYFGGGTQAIVGILASFNPAGLIAHGLNRLSKTLFGFDLFDAGRRIVSTLLDGIGALASRPAEIMESIVAQVRDLLPFSPAREGPLSDLHRIGLVQTIADTIRPDGLVKAMAATAGAGMAAFAAAASAAAPAIVAPITPEFTPALEPPEAIARAMRAAPAAPPPAPPSALAPVTRLDLPGQSPPSAARSAAPSAAPAPVTLNVTFQVNGGLGGDGQDLMDQLRAREPEIVAFIERGLARAQSRRF